MFVLFLRTREEGDDRVDRKPNAPGRDLIETLHRLTNAAEVFVNRSPKVKRLEAERSALLDAIAAAQLALSVQRLPTESRSEQQASSSDSKYRVRLEAALKQAEARMTELQRALRPLSDELETLKAGADRAKALLHKIETSEPQDHAA
jgi:chromosome segregation ATPase